MKKFIKASKYSLIVLLILSVCYYISLVFVFNLNIREDYRKQIIRMDALRRAELASIDEQSFVKFDISDNNLKLNDIQFLATHNSYKAMPNMYISGPLSLIGGKRTRNGWYGMPNLYDQLDSGVRGLELDITKYGNKFIMMHDPLTDWRTNGADFALMLEEIKIWSDNNPSHIPINIMLQVRSSWTIYTTKFNKVKAQDLIMLDNILNDTFGSDGIIKPSDIIGGYSSLNEAVLDNNWPELSDCLGKVYFTILFDTEEIEKAYYDIDNSFNTQLAFVFRKPDSDIKSYTAFILADSPFTEGLEEYVDNNYMLRTRIDIQFDHNPARLNASIALGSNILATDYPEGNLYKDGYVAKIADGGVTVIDRAE